MGTKSATIAVLFAALTLMPTETAPPVIDMPPEAERTQANTAIAIFTGETRRIPEGLHLHTKGLATKTFISGIDLKTDISTLPGIQDGFDILEIELDCEARNTRENAINTARWLQDKGYKHVILVTSDFHMERSLYLLQRQLRYTRIGIHTHAVESNTPGGWESERFKMWVTRRGIHTRPALWF